MPLDDVDDPFEEFNRAMGAGIVSDPYPDFVELRKQAPVVPTDVRRLMGLDESVVLPEEMPDVYTVLTFDGVQQVLRDGETFSSAGYAAVMGPVMGHTILEMDEPEHHAYRALVQQAFTRKAMERWSNDLIGPVIDEMIDAFVDDGRTELVRNLTLPFPVTVIAGMLGLPREDLPQFHRWTIELIGVSIDWERAIAASKRLADYFQAIIDERRVSPTDDVISVLAHAELDGHRLTDDEIIAFLRVLLPAGAETTYRSSSNLLVGLLRHPEQLDAVRADRSLVPRAIEEGLRWEPPLLTIQRTATRDTEIDGVPVKEGTVLVVNLGAANHDPTRWDRAEEFDVFRDPAQHMAFAFGPHMCLGMHLARMETAVLLDRLFDRLPGLRLDPDAEPPLITGMTFRSPTTLHVAWG
ncbi:MAG TPA: cytochrome P450 [Acidimicrobiia bacterium]|nr:cytochrome P450 [Acidimicrobiia bacterium]